MVVQLKPLEAVRMGWCTWTGTQAAVAVALWLDRTCVWVAADTTIAMLGRPSQTTTGAAGSVNLEDPSHH